MECIIAASPATDGHSYWIEERPSPARPTLTGAATGPRWSVIEVIGESESAQMTIVATDYGSRESAEAGARTMAGLRMEQIARSRGPRIGLPVPDDYRVLVGDTYKATDTRQVYRCVKAWVVDEEATAQFEAEECEKDKAMTLSDSCPDPGDVVDFWRGRCG